MPAGVKKNRTRLVLSVTAALLVCAAAAVLLLCVRVGGRLYLRADTIDARGAALSCADYDAARARLPGTAIRWSVPVGEERFDSFSEELVLSALPEDEIDRLGYFPRLRRVDASRCAELPAVAAAAARFPALSFSWQVPTAEGAVDGNAEALAPQRLSYAELRDLIPLLPRLRTLDLRQSALSLAEIDALAAAFPETELRYTLRFWGVELPSDARTLRLDASAAGDAAELKDALGRLTALESADLRAAALSLDELEELLPLCPADTRFSVPLGGALFDSDCEEIDLSGTAFSGTDEIERAAALLTKLKKLVLCGCGIPDEEMAALCARHPETRFVWTVYFSVYSLRTDATVFCASDLPSRGFVAPAASSEELAPLRYCTDLVALDLGHMFFKDLSFLEGLTKLKYLILVEERFHDISPLASLEELEYLELFNNTIDDVSPLLSLKKLRHLNIGYTRGYDPAPLWEMTWLERLWYPGNRLGRARCAELSEALAGTRCYLPSADDDGSTGGGWRTDPAYYEMRNTFGMFYQPGGTGTEKNG